MDAPCKNCGFNNYELVDGQYYCTECHELVENIVEKEIDEYENENIVFDIRGGIKQKDSKKEEEKRRAATESKCTSFEEYNYILRGLVDEILMIEKIPNFKKTVLQLWITYLKYTEVAFFDQDNLAHLPKFHAYYRHQDAVILYNKRPFKYKRKYKPKPKVEIKIEDDTAEGRKVKRRSSRKSLKKIQKMNDESESNISSNTSTLTNMTIEDIEATMLGQELNIEFSNVAKQAKQRYQDFMKNRNRKILTNEDGEVVPTMNRYHAYKDYVLILSGRVLLYIIYCALNICGSDIQLTDLLRFAREGILSYYNFKKLLPENLEDVKLSLTKYHSLCYKSQKSFLFDLKTFLFHFPDIKKSLKMPKLIVLAKRYIDDLCLPSVIFDYVEKLMELLPSKLNYNSYIPNFEARAIAYILFILKLIFGIDGFREKEISDSARKINHKLKSLGVSEKLFNFEAWREYIEYREIILTKYYYASIFNSQYKLDQPYENYASMLHKVQPVTFNVYNPDEKLSKHHKTVVHKKAVTKELVQKLLNLHDEKPSANLNFESSFTPLKDAFKVILESPLEATINTNLVTDFTDDVLEYYFDPEKLENLFVEHEVLLVTKKVTFPKNFCLEKPLSMPLNCISMYGDMKLSHETIDEKKWIKNLIKQENENCKIKEEKRLAYHVKAMPLLLHKRLKLRKSIKKFKKKNNRISTDDTDIEYDEIADTDDVFYNSSEHDEELTFVYPDFNLWHRKMRFGENLITKFKEDVKKLPKTMVWLLDTASKVIHLDRETIYFHLITLENEFTDYYKPLELTDNELIVKNINEKRKGLHNWM
ncbi:TATA box-binding protein-associated factor RNA polymerase I subunit B [Chironomus tepperi]|uniref:TATA box-binding protein-associated factor RNA polymerase I subunit B n=1 Tax=Chironomus tepperi TaxID=113505 RepID=UPI00391FAA1D